MLVAATLWNNPVITAVYIKMDFHCLQVLRKILTTTPQSPASGGLGAWLNCFLQEVEFVIIFSVFLLRAVPDNCK